MGLIDQIEEANLRYSQQLGDLYKNLSVKSGKKIGETPGNPIFTNDINLHRMPNVLDNMYGFLRTETTAHYKTMDSKLTVMNRLLGELIDVTYSAWGETQNFDTKEFISESNSNLQIAIKESIEDFNKRLIGYQNSRLRPLQKTMVDLMEQERDDPQPRELDPKQHKELKDRMEQLSDKMSKVGTAVGAGLKTAAGMFTNTLLTFGTDYYNNEFTNKISDSVESVESKIGTGLNKLGDMTSSLRTGLQGIANSLTGGLGNLADIYTDPQVQKAFAKYGSSGMTRAQDLYSQRIDIMKELIRDYGYSESEARQIATKEMTRTGTRDYSRLSYQQQLSYQRSDMDYTREIQKRRQQEQRDWNQSALLSAVEIFKTPKQIATAQKQIYEMDRIMPGLNFQATEFYKTMISVFDDTGKMSKEMFEEIRYLSKNLMVDPQTLLNIGNTYTKYLKLMTKGGINFQKQMTNVIKVTAKLEDQFVDSQSVFGEINEIGFTMLSNMSDDLLTKTQLYAKELGMSVTEFQRTARSAPAEAAELLLSAKRSYAERMGIDTSGDIGEREMALLQQIGVTGFESITEFLGQSQSDLSKADVGLKADQGTEFGPLQRQIELSNEVWERQLSLLDREYERRMSAWEEEQKILHDWENTYYTDWEKRQLEMDKELLDNTALDIWNDRLLTASRGTKGLGDMADATRDKMQAAGVAMADGVGSLLGSLFGTIGGKAIGGIGGKLFGKTKNSTTNMPSATGELDTSVFDKGASSKGASVDWGTIAKDFAIIAGGIVLVAGSIEILGKFGNSETLQKGAENTRIIGEGFRNLYEPVGVVLGAGAALGWLMQSKIVDWKYLGSGLLAIEGGIAAVATPIGIIGRFDTKLFERGRDNSIFIGEAMRALYEPVGVILAASEALGALFISTGGFAAGAMVAGLAGIESGIAAVAVPIYEIGKHDSSIFQKGAENARVIGEAMDSLYKPVSLTITAATALGGIFTGTLGLGWIAMKSGFKGMHLTLNEIGEALKEFGDKVEGIDTNMVSSAANAGLLLTELVNNLPKEGGFLSIFKGKTQSMSDFTADLITFGKGLNQFADVTKDLNQDSITNSRNIIDFVMNIDYNKLNEINDTNIKSKLINIADGIKAYENINFTEVEYALNTRLNEFINNLDYETIGDNFRIKLQEALCGIYDGKSTFTVTMKFTDLPTTGEIGENIVKLGDLNNIRNELIEKLQGSIKITDKRINNFNWDSNSRLQTINSTLSTIKSDALTNRDKIVEAITKLSNGFKPFWKMVDEASNGNKSNLLGEGDGSDVTINPTGNEDPYAKYGITSKFGPRKRPTANASTFHKGIDYGIPKGTAIPAFDNGVVVGNDYNKLSGNYVVVENSKGYRFSFCHLDSKSPLQIGESVKPGTTVGYCGTTGASTGPHLHLGIKNPNGEYIDPQKYFSSNPGISSEISGISKLNELLAKIGIVQAPTDLDTLELSGNKKDFVNKMLQYATISANLLKTTPGTILAQWALESAWGTSNFAKTRNNFAGINAIDRDPGRATYFKTPADFATEYAKFIGVNPDGSYRNTRYMRSGILGKSGLDYYSILKRNGYATDPYYVSKLTGIYNSLGVHKTGLSRVPYDNYPALLHKDERVLNANEAQVWDNIQESRMGEYEPSIQDVTVYVDTDAVIDSISTLTDVVREIHQILKPKTHTPVQQTIRPKSNLITQYI